VLATPALLSALPRALIDELQQMSVAALAAGGEAAAYLGRLGTQAVVIRPDRNILGIASTLSELEAVVGRIPLRGRIRRHDRATLTGSHR
jgi:uroporphyrinogen-III synthase